MTEREMGAWELFAAAALTGAMSHPDCTDNEEKLIVACAKGADAMMVEWRRRLPPTPVITPEATPVLCHCGALAKHVIRHRLRHTMKAQPFNLCDRHVAMFRGAGDPVEGEQYLTGEGG